MLVKTKKVVEILQKSKRKNNKWGKYCSLITWDLMFIGSVSKIDVVSKIIDIFGYSFIVSDIHTRDWYECRKKDYTTWAYEWVYFL